MKKSQSGFTLIELVMVIVILGVLAAVALPKFVDLSGDAKQAAISGAAGALSSASAINYAKASIKGGALCDGTVTTGCTRLNGTTPAATLVGTSAAPGFNVSSWDYANFTITTDTTCATVAAGNTVQAVLTYPNSGSPLKTATATIVCTG
jgi:MSHA pilin protein MshA